MRLCLRMGIVHVYGVYAERMCLELHALARAAATSEMIDSLQDAIHESAKRNGRSGSDSDAHNRHTFHVSGSSQDQRTHSDAASASAYVGSIHREDATRHTFVTPAAAYVQSGMAAAIANSNNSSDRRANIVPIRSGAAVRGS